jgi:hypothetical protein
MKTFDDYDPSGNKRSARVHMLIRSYPKLKTGDIDNKLEEHFGEIYTGLTQSVKDEMRDVIITWLTKKKKAEEEILQMNKVIKKKHSA